VSHVVIKTFKRTTLDSRFKYLRGRHHTHRYIGFVYDKFNQMSVKNKAGRIIMN